MKKLFLLLLVSFSALYMQAQKMGGIHINAHHNLVVVYLNGQLVNTPATSCFIANLDTGHYLIEVYEARSHSGRRHSSDKGRCCLYRERINFTRNEIKKIELTDNGKESWNDAWDDSWDSSWNDSWEDAWNDFDGFGNHHSNVPRVMPMEIFQQFYHTIKKEPFEKEKFKLIEQGCIIALFTCQQCAALIDLFSFDKEKIRVMKTMYPAIVNKEYFYSLTEKLSFLSSKEEINRFLKQYHGR